MSKHVVNDSKFLKGTRTPVGRKMASPFMTHSRAEPRDTPGTRPGVTRTPIRRGLNWSRYGELLMRLAALIGTSVLGLVLGTAAPARAQHDHDDDERHGDSQKHHGNGHEKEHGRSAREQHSDRQEGNARDERREHHSQGRGPEHIRQSNRPEHDEHFRPRDGWQAHRAKDWKHEHHGWHERGGYRGYRIPEDRFHANFGRGHWFRVRSNPIIVLG